MQEDKGARLAEVLGQHQPDAETQGHLEEREKFIVQAAVATK